MSNGGSYDPKSIEPGIYDFWESGGFFNADPHPEKQPYVIMMPPPNVTGALHLGHAMYTLQDVLVRWKRMCGCNALWMPGIDHAGIATQAVVEKKLREEQGLTRHEIGRDALVARIWQWKEEYGDRILRQLRRLGVSCDWRRTRFTLDDTCARAVYEMFFQLFKAGLIYRGLRLVNWDTQLQTAVADDEVYHETVKGSLWHIRYPLENADHESRFAAGGGQTGRDYLIVATTRPETMLADTAVAVHPDDERYNHLVGRRVILPLTGRTIPLIADAELVKREFGTGCVKVTPGHDPNDYACYLRHKGQPDEIGIRNMMTPDGRVHADNAGEPFQAGQPGRYAGLKLDEARKKVVADLEAAGLLEKVEPYETDVGHSDRSKSPIQPYLSEQWFVKMGRNVGADVGPDLAELTMEAVRDGRVQFHPVRYKNTYLDWLGEKRDWCISRQLWWGHRIPVWHRRVRLTAENSWHVIVCDLGVDHAILGETPGASARIVRSSTGADWSSHLRRTSVERAPDGQLVYHISMGAFQADWLDEDFDVYVCCQNPKSGIEWEKRGFSQDPDVLDTWFSSALWPMNTLGWPHDDAARCSQPSLKQGREPSGCTDSMLPTRADYDYFFPTDVLCTGRGIITLWVARMVMNAVYFTGRVPFRHVYINPTILDGHGQVMSKSKGNGVDPLDIIELYGTDALRFTLAQMATETQDIRMPVKPVKLPDGRHVNGSDKFEAGRNLANKLWQAANGLVLPSLQGVKIERNAPRQVRKEGCALHAGDSRTDTVVRKAHPTGSGPGANKPEAQAPGLGRAPAASHNVTADGGATVACAPGSIQGEESGNGFYHTSVPPAELPLFDRWIRTRLQHCIAAVTRHLEDYHFSSAADELRGFFWNEFCDWYLEEIKVRLRDLQEGPAADSDECRRKANDLKIVLLGVFDNILALFHPIMPFVTEELWKRVGEVAPRHHEVVWNQSAKLCFAPPAAAPALIVMQWPQVWPEAIDDAVDREVGEVLQPVIRALRDIRASVNALRSAAKQPALRTLPKAAVKAGPEVAAQLIENLAMLQRLGACDALEIGPAVVRPPESASKVLSGIEVYVPLTGLADLEIERKRLRKDLDELSPRIEQLMVKLADENFTAKAPTQLVEKEHARLAEMKSRADAIRRNLTDLGA